MRGFISGITVGGVCCANSPYCHCQSDIRMHEQSMNHRANQTLYEAMLATQTKFLANEKLAINHKNPPPKKSLLLLLGA